ncbi:MAG: site-specific integrase, partial [Planctomycetes bacterium]|nr:site-specific integrase [Planctomycetota bacterium]
MVGFRTSGNPNEIYALVQATARLIVSALAPSTIVTYNRTLTHFKQFLTSLTPRYRPFPANAGHVALYVTHLHQAGMAPATIVSKLSAISFV